MDTASLDQIRSITRAFKKPADFTLVTVEANDGAIWLCVYENEISAFEYETRENIYVYLNNIKLSLEKGGLKVYLVGRPGDPPATGR